MQEKADHPATRLVTRQDDIKAEEKWAAIRLAVQKHRANQSEQKKMEVRKKGMAYYYKMKEKRKAVELEAVQKNQANQSKQNSLGCASHQEQLSEDCPLYEDQHLNEIQ